MKTLRFILAGLVAAICLPAKEPGKSTLGFTLPDGWTQQTKLLGENERPFYTFDRDDPHGLLMVHRWMFEMPAENIRPVLQGMAADFPEQLNARMKESGAGPVEVTGPRYELIEGAEFSGEACVFELTTNEGIPLVQALCFMVDGPEAWQGQFTGGAYGWRQAKAILASMRRNPDSAPEEAENGETRAAVKDAPSKEGQAQ